MHFIFYNCLELDYIQYGMVYPKNKKMYQRAAELFLYLGRSRTFLTLTFSAFNKAFNLKLILT